MAKANELTKVCIGGAETDDPLWVPVDADTNEVVLNDAEFMLQCAKSISSCWSGGNQWSGWCAFLDFWAEVFNISSDKFGPYKVLALRSGPRVMTEDFVMISDRPLSISTEIVDNVHRLHNEDGPACEYRDGWKLWYIGNVMVNEQIVMAPETQTLQQIEKEDNTEVRRIRIERYGWEKYLVDSKATLVDQRKNDRDGQTEKLYRLADGQQRFVCVDPSTGRRYALGVPRDAKNCDEAQQWMSNGLDKRAIHRS